MTQYKLVTYSTRHFFFFFKAEDGIRDHCVTGVQTCALPISVAVLDHLEAVAQRDRLEIGAGSGGTFCAGADLKAIALGDGLQVVEDGDGPMGPTRMRLGKPVIAAIKGHAVAGGLELALWGDLRVAPRDGVLGVFNRRFRLTPV